MQWSRASGCISDTLQPQPQVCAVRFAVAVLRRYMHVLRVVCAFVHHAGVTQHMLTTRA